MFETVASANADRWWMPVPPLQIRLASDRELGYQASTFRHTPRAIWNAAVAQLVEHVIRNDGVVGSSPISGTIKINRLTQALGGRLRGLFVGR